LIEAFFYGAGILPGEATDCDLPRAQRCVLQNTGPRRIARAVFEKVPSDRSAAPRMANGK
jgi:hypothetical protein